MAMREVPHSLDAEMAVLGSMILSARAIDEALSIVRVDDFYQHAHAIVFDAIHRVHLRGKADLVTLSEALSQSDMINEMGGVEYLIQLAESVPTASNCAHYCAIVREKAILRSLETIGRQIAKMPYDSDSSAPEQVLGAIGLLEKLTGGGNDEPVSIADEVFRLSGKVDPGVPSGIYEIDSRTAGGGYYPGEPNYLAGAKGTGKTNWLVQACIRACRMGLPVRFASCELRAKKIARRVMRQLTGASSADDALAFGLMAQWDSALREVAGWDFKVWDSGSSDLTVERITARLRADNAKKPVGFFAVDYVQLLDSAECPITKGKTPCMERVEHHLRRANSLMPNCVFLLASQLAGNADDGYYTANSQEFGKGAAAVYMLLRDSEESYRLFCDKNRDGADKWTAALRFEKSTLTFHGTMAGMASHERWDLDRDSAPLAPKQEEMEV